MYGINAKNELIEGEKCIFVFTTPTCWDIHGFNFRRCRKNSYQLKLSQDIQNGKKQLILQNILSTNITDKYQFNL